VDPIHHLLTLHCVVVGEDRRSDRSVRSSRSSQQRAGGRIAPIDKLQRSVQVSLCHSPAGRLAGTNAEQLKSVVRLQTVASRCRAVVHQKWLDRLDERLHGCRRHPLNQVVQLFGRRGLFDRFGRNILRRWPLRQEPQPPFQKRNHRMGRICGLGIGQLPGRAVGQAMPLAPSCQSDMVSYIPLLDRSALSQISFPQIGRAEFYLARPDADLTARQRHVILVPRQGDSALKYLPVAKQQHAIGWRRWAFERLCRSYLGHPGHCRDGQKKSRGRAVSAYFGSHSGGETMKSAGAGQERIQEVEKGGDCLCDTAERRCSLGFAANRGCGVDFLG